MIKSGYNNTSKSKSWNVLETVMSHLKFAGTHLYTWVERYTVRVECSTQKRNKISSARAQPQTTWFRVKSTNHEATVPTSIKWVTLKIHVATAVYRFKWDSYHYNHHLHVSTLQYKSSFPNNFPVCMGNWQIDNTVRHAQSSVLTLHLLDEVGSKDNDPGG